MKSNKSISRKNFFNQIQFFAISKMDQTQFFEQGKSLKLPEMQFYEEKKVDLFDFTSFIDVFDFTSFSAWTFLNFLAYCGSYYLCL